MRRVTIKDIAKIAGVSYASVSRALSGSTEVSEATRERIVAICEQEGYRVNTLARSLICQRSGVIGLVVPDISNAFYAEIAFAIETYARRCGYNVMLCNTVHDARQTTDLFEYLVGHRVEGIIFASTRNDARSWAAKYRDAVPVVLLGDADSTGDPQGDRVNSVSLDNHAGGVLGAKYLYKLGHRRILYLGMRPVSITHQRRFQGYRMTMESLGLEPAVIENPWDASTIEYGYQLAREAFSKQFPFTAAFCASDSVALGAMQAAGECGVRIPEDVSLLGFDNVSYAALPRICLSTIAQHQQKLSEAAFDLLLRLIREDGEAATTHRIVRPILVERSTCIPI